jgi:hypothetical protein
MNMAGWREITNGYGETCLVIMDHDIHAVSPQSFAKGFGLQSGWISKPSSS